MGLAQKARAARKVVQSRAQAAVGTAEDIIDGQAYRGLKRGAAAATEVARSRGRQGTQAVLARLAESDRAAAVGAAVQRGAAELAGLPGLSLVGDAVKARNGVLDAARRVRQQPGDALVTVQLAECLWRAEADMRAYRLLRAMTAPPSMAVTYAIKSGAALGGTRRPEPQSVRAARKAAVLGAVRLRRQPGDATAFHALARAALLEGRPEALPLARSAADAAGGDGAELVTLARTYLALDRWAEAAESATLAVQRGCSVGYEVLADVKLRQGLTGSFTDQVAAYERMLDRVSIGDHRSYYGVERTPGSLARSLLVAQGDKAWSTTVRAGRVTAGAVKVRMQATRQRSASPPAR